jgi:hypothetical protein
MLRENRCQRYFENTQTGRIAAYNPAFVLPGNNCRQFAFSNWMEFLNGFLDLSRADAGCANPQ